MRNTEKLANRIILIVISLILLIFLLLSKSTSLLQFAFSGDTEHNLDYLKSEYDKNIFEKDRFIIGYGWLADKLGVKEINNLIKYEDVAYYKDKDIVDIDKKTNAVKALNDKLSGKLVFVLLPSPIMSDNDTFQPYFFTDTFNGVHSFLNSIRSEGVGVYDLSQYHNNKPLAYRYFYSDHHWRPEFCFEFIEPVANIFRDYYSDSNTIDSKYFNIDNYNIETYKKLALGSYGKRVGHKFLQPDDFSIITPKYDTDFIVHSEDKKKRESFKGDFDKVFIARNHLDYDYMNVRAYTSYSRYARELMHSHNQNPVIRSKVILLMDSYSYPLSLFLCNIFEDVYTIDLRYQDDKIMETIDSVNPDLVLMLYSQYAFDYPELFEFK